MDRLRASLKLKGNNTRMDLLKLSKFKLHLRSVVSEVRHLRERERAATEQHRDLLQKQKQAEEERGRNLQELQAELASSNESRRNLERKVSYLENDNALLENKNKELNATIKSLLQTRDSFVKAYEESTCEMKRAIEARDRRIKVLAEKIQTHLSLFDSIEKEARSIKKLADNVQSVVSEKEEVANGLRSKMDKVSAFETVFIERIVHLENKVKNDEDEIRRKDKIISEMMAELEAEKFAKSIQCQVEELQRTVLSKDDVIHNLISEKEALHSEVSSLSVIFQKIQQPIATMNHKASCLAINSKLKDNAVFSSAMECQADYDMMAAIEEYSLTRTDAPVEKTGETSPNAVSSFNQSDAGNQASPACQDRNSVCNPLEERNNFSSRVPEFACQSTRSDHFKNAKAGGLTNPTTKEQVTEAPLKPMEFESSTLQVVKTPEYPE